MYVVETRPMRLLRAFDDGTIVSTAHARKATKYPTFAAAQTALVLYGIELCDGPRILRVLKQGRHVSYEAAL